MKWGKPVLAVDIGGTKILAALVSNGQIIFKDYSPTHAAEGKHTVISHIFGAIDRVLGQSNHNLSQISSICIVAAGAIDTNKGMVTLSPNLTGWRNVPLVKLIQEKYPVETYLMHDANAAAVGEHRCGAGIGTKDMVFITVSSGIGGGFIIDSKLYEGSGGAAGEIGHMTIDIHGPECPCGNTGCLEMMASGKAMAREAIRFIRAGEKSVLVEKVKGKIENITAREIREAAEQGDTLALQVVNKIALNLGVGLVNMINIFNPEAIVIGGGLSNFGEMLLGPARTLAKERAFPFPAKMVKIVKGELGEEAGIIRAAAFLNNKS